MTVFGSFALIGATISGAAAAAYPSPFTANSAVVYGASAAPSDMTAATEIMDGLNTALGVEDDSTTVTLTGGESITENEVVLGGSIISGDIKNPFLEKHFGALIDEKLRWDNGTASTDYDLHEQIVIDGVSVETSFNDTEYEGVALTNEKGILYKLVLEQPLVGVGNTSADTLYLTILGKEYEVTGIGSNGDSITIVTSEQKSLSVGDSTTIDGKTFTVDAIFGTSVEVNGQIINDKSSKKIDGMKVEVDSIGYHSNAPEQSRVVLKIGEDLLKTYTNGDEYIGEDEDDPNWRWEIANLHTVNGYIGVRYDQKQIDATDEVVYEGGSYLLPENFGEIKFEGLTDVTYEDIEVSFAQREDLWNLTSSDSDPHANGENQPVVVITSTLAEAFDFGDIETNTIYLRYAAAGEEVNGSAVATGSVEVYAKDVDGDYTPTNKPRLVMSITMDDAAGTLGSTGIVLYTNDETTLNISIEDQNLTIGNVEIALGGSEGFTHITGKFEYLGSIEDDAEAGDVSILGTTLGTEDADVMDFVGTIVKEIEANADRDKVVISVPDEQVFAKVSVTVGGEATEEEGDSTGVKVYKDSETSSFAGKNIIVVGGSAINAIAAELLGGAYEGEAFTTATTVGAGKFLIESFARGDKTALLVAGYNAADTEMGVDYLVNKGVDTTEGNKYIGTSATEATLVTA
jgi:hypothetical protein